MSKKQEKIQLLREALLDKEKIVADRRHLHAHPETGFDLTGTLTYVKAQLLEMGYEVKPCGRAGLVACAGGYKKGRTFLLRADMDALPILEEADCAFASHNGKMHGCGHDMHTSMLLQTARILKIHEKEIHGTIKLMFQPAEELLEGAKDMLESGVLENPKVDAGLMLHVMTGMDVPVGTAIVSGSGVSAPAADYFTINIQGKGCHGSMPHKGIDPITVAAHILLSLQEIPARELAMSEDTVLTIGSLQAGTAANVIPHTASLHGTLRAYEENIREYVKERMYHMVSHIANAFRAKAELTFTSSCPTLKNNEDLSNCTLSYLHELMEPQMVLSAAEIASANHGNISKSSGSEDFAYISHQIPTIMIALAAGEPQKGYLYPLHHPKVQFDEDALPYGAAIYAHVAMRWLEEHP